MLSKSKYYAQGKTTMKHSDPTYVSNRLVELPSTIKMYYSDVELVADVLHLKDLHFLTSTSNYVQYGTVNTVDNMKCVTLEQGLQNIIRC